jgi:2-C-methyl-D-erythritol 4-phosphate cytidylyltransferase
VSKLPFTLIIPAAGSGKRIGSEIAKPFLRVAGKSLLGHTVSRFAAIDGLIQVIIATTPDYFDEAFSVKNWLPETVSFQVIEGGSERQFSIDNALQKADKSAVLIAIHDAVRPLVSENCVVKCLEKANESGAAILGVPVKDTIKKVNDGGLILETPDRNMLWQAQTPQIFRQDLIRKAYQNAINENYLGTDDASLVEYYGERVFIVEGNQQNIKITYPLDLQIAEILLTDK